MAVPANTPSAPRWSATLRSESTLADDLGAIGCWVGPRTGPYARSTEQREDYVLRRLVVAWREVGTLRFPVEVRTGLADLHEPDFVISGPDGKAVGVEVTEAGSREHQRHLTLSEPARAHGLDVSGPRDDVNTDLEIKEFASAIARKSSLLRSGSYRGVRDCELVVYANTGSPVGDLQGRGILAALGTHADRGQGFKHVHIVDGLTVYLDVHAEKPRQVPLFNVYEIDYAAWIYDQVEKLRRGATNALDLAHIAEELDDLGSEQRHKLASHLANVIAHLLKWQYQLGMRSRSWQGSIDEGRRSIARLLDANPSLKPAVKSYVADEYDHARRVAMCDTGLSRDAFPEACPYSAEEIVDPEFFPGEPDSSVGSQQ